MRSFKRGGCQVWSSEPNDCIREWAPIAPRPRGFELFVLIMSDSCIAIRIWSDLENYLQDLIGTSRIALD